MAQASISEEPPVLAPETSVGSSLGIKQLAPGDPPAVDIVAIHGLDGHREDSWTIENVLWLRDLLPSKIPTARILTYGYDARTRGHVQLSSQTLFDHSETFLAKLALFRQNTDTRDRPIIFVAHSLGGIVLKEALIRANAATRNHLPDHKAIELSTHGIIFLGTPHQGTKTASIGSIFLGIQSIYSSTNKTVIKHLERDSEFLQSQLARYTSISENFDTKFVYEALPTRTPMGMITLVPKSSAVVPGAVNAEAIALSKDHVGIAKFASSEDEAFQSVCRYLTNMASHAPSKIARKWTLYNKSEEILSGTETNISHNVTLPSQLFTGRMCYLERLNRHFCQRAEGSQRRFLLYGMGGAGKTQICLKFIEENSDQFWRIFWIDSSNAETIKLGFQNIANDPEARASKVEQSTEAVLQWISRTNREWLLVFDNADGGPDVITKFIPRGNRGNVLITSRSQNVSRVVSRADSVEVDAMGEEEAISLLLKAADLEVTSEKLREAARPIVTQLCFLLPLAVDQAGAAIQTGLCNIEDYFQMYSAHRQRLLDDPLFEGASNYGRAVYGTWDLSYKAIKDRATGQPNSGDDSAIIILETFAFLHNENIAESIFQRAAEAPGPTGCEIVDPSAPFSQTIPDPPLRLLQLGENGSWDPLFFREGIRVLLSFSLIRRGASGNAYSVHGLVHSWSQDRIPRIEQQTKCRSANALLYRSITHRFAIQDYAFRRSLIPHIKANANYAAKAGVAKIYNDDEYSNYWVVYNKSGDWKEAEELGVQIVETRKRVLGADHPLTLTSMHNLATTFWNLGRWEDTKVLQVQVIEARKRIFGPDHPTMVVSMNNLARTLSDQGQWKEAEELQVRIMETRKRVLGADHPEVLALTADLARTLLRRGRFKDAEELQVQVIESIQKMIGADHPDTLMSMNDLALTLLKQGRWKEAEELLVRVIEKRKSVLGADHPATLTSMSTLATTFWHQGRWQEAEELQVRILEVWKRDHGADHPDTLTTMGNLALTVLKLGRLTEAEELQVQVLESSKRVYGVDHPNLLTSMDNLAKTFSNRGQWEKAEKLQIQVVETRERVLGVDHPDTLTSTNDLATTFSHRGRRKEAEKLQVRVMETRKQALGVDHPQTRASMVNLVFK